MNNITQSIIAFCQDPEKTHMPFPNNPRGNRKEDFVKVALSPSLLGLAIVNSKAFKYATDICCESISMYGFYSTCTHKLYFDDRLDLCAWEPIEHEPLPHITMMKQLTKELTKTFSATVVPDDVDINSDAVNIAEKAFFLGLMDKKEIKSTDFDEDAKSEFFRIEDAEEFLKSPEDWLAAAVKKALQYKGEYFKKIFRKRLTIYAILEKLKKTPDHPWHKIKQLEWAVFGKNTVTVEVATENGPIAFKANTDSLRKKYSGWYQYPVSVQKSKKVTASQYHINDILSVTYRNNILYP